MHQVTKSNLVVGFVARCRPGPENATKSRREGAGAEVEVIATENGALVRPAVRRRRGLDAVAHLRDRADGGLDAEDVLRLTRGDEPA
jgi:hypothetical protein